MKSKPNGNGSKNTALITYFLITLALLGSGYGIYSAQKPRVMCIDLIKILANSNEMKELVEEFELKEKAMKARNDTLVNEIQEEMKQTEKQLDSKKLSDQEKKSLSDRINSKQSQFFQFKQLNEQKMSEQRTAASQKIMDKVNKLSADYAKKHGYKIVLGATGNGNLIYLDEACDLTDVILKLLNHE